MISRSNRSISQKFCLLALLAGSVAATRMEAQLYVGNEDGNTVSVIDPNSDFVLRTITVGGGPSAIVLNPAHTRAYTSNTNDGTVSVIDLTTNTVIATITVGNDPDHLVITPNGAKVYVSNSDDGTVSVINTGTNLVSTTITLPITAPDVVTPTPAGIAVTPNGLTVYVANEDGVNSYTIDTTTDTPTAHNIGIQGQAVAITPDGTEAYFGGNDAVNTSLGRLQVVNVPANTLGALLNLPASPHGVAFTPDGTKAYTTNEDAGNVSVIDTATTTIIRTIAGFSEPSQAIVSADGRTLYVSDTGDPIKDGDRVGYCANCVIAFDTAGINFLGYTPVGEDPEGMALGPLSLPGDRYQVRYAANLGAGQSVIDITNAGTTGRNICANVYVFAEDEQLIACCSCPITPNGLATLSVQNDLISNTLTPGVPVGVTVALYATAQAGICDPALAGVPYDPGVAGMRAWGTTLHAQPVGGYAVAETPFSFVGLSPAEYERMTGLCGFIEADGSGYGICASCRAGAAGAKKQ